MIPSQQPLDLPLIAPNACCLAYYHDVVASAQLSPLSTTATSLPYFNNFAFGDATVNYAMPSSSPPPTTSSTMSSSAIPSPALSSPAVPSHTAISPAIISRQEVPKPVLVMQPPQPYIPYMAIPEDPSVMQALDIARDTFEGSIEPTVCRILDEAIERIWGYVLAQPDTYILTKDQFAVFNYFQARFRGNKIAQAATARFWNNFRGE
ncbi:hypothetical protein OQA88_11307 [Cercophora sp. LCS_1]